MAWQKEWKVDNPQPIKDAAKILIDLIPDSYNCEVVGDLALDFTDEGWNIYHVPTGACFDSAVPDTICPYCLGTCNPFPDGSGYCVECTGTGKGTEYSKEQLLAWMAKVQQSNPTAWTMLRLLTKDTYATEGASAKKIIKEWCLSVKVE